RDDASRISWAGYYAAKHNRGEIVDYLLSLGADRNTLAYGATRKDHLELLRHILTDDEIKSRAEDISLLSQTNHEARIAAWLKEQGLDFPMPQSERNAWKNIYSDVQIPDYMIVYANIIVYSRKFKNEVPSFDKNTFLFYLFVKFDYQFLENFIIYTTGSYNRIHPRTARYCFSRNKYIDLLIKYYPDSKNLFGELAIRYERFDLLPQLGFTEGMLPPEYMDNKADLMVRNPAIYSFIKKRTKVLPLIDGIRKSSFKDRPKMLKLIYKELNN